MSQFEKPASGIEVLRDRLGQVTSPKSAAALIAALGFPTNDSPLNWLELRNLNIVREKFAPALKGFYELGHTPDGDMKVYLVQANDKFDGWQKQVDKLCRAFAANQPEHPLFVVTHDFRTLELINPRLRMVRGSRRVKLVRACLPRLEQPSRFQLELLRDIALHEGASGQDAYQQQCKSFSVDAITNRFYREYKGLYDRVKKALRESNPGIREFIDEANDPERKLHSYALRLLGRIMFLYFLQQKGWLDGKRDFLTRQFKEAQARGDSFMHSVLDPLFFDTLNKPDRPANDSKFGKIPYLNGGLFTRTQDEIDWGGTIHLENDVFDPALYNPDDRRNPNYTVLGLLNNYRFTLREDTPLDTEVDLDPEMLGRVFENLLEAEDRKKSGTYYTPRAIVHYMCREALLTHLHSQTEVSKDELYKLLDFENLEEGIRPKIPSAKLEELERAITGVKVCDPAVGSGAFLLGMLYELITLRRGIYWMRGDEINPHGGTVAKWKREFVSNCLFGVDIKKEACEIAKLRLWLSLVVDLDNPDNLDPLPNLDFKVMSGDSLVDTIGGVEIIPREKIMQQVLLGMTAEESELNELNRALAHFRRRLERLQKEYFTHAKLAAEAFDANDGWLFGKPVGERYTQEEHLKIKKLIHATEAEIVQQFARARTQGMEIERKKLVDAVHPKADGRKKLSASELKRSEKALDRIDEARARLAQLSERVRRGEALPYFLWELHFPEVFNRPGAKSRQEQGFDIIVMNPPYVRQEKLNADTQKSYEVQYADVYCGTADLYVYFYRRAFELLRLGGVTAVISSNSFIKRTYGVKLQDYLAQNTSIQRVIDFGELPIFDAAVEPLVFIGSKEAPQMSQELTAHQLFHLVSREVRGSGRSNIQGVREEIDDLDKYLEKEPFVITHAALKAHHWTLENKEVLALYDKLMRTGAPLGEFVQGKMYYGIKTGLNNAFVIDEAKRAELICADPKSAELIKPWLRGRDIKRWKPTWVGRYCIVIPSSGDQKHAWSGCASEADAEAVFRKERPALASHLWQSRAALKKRQDKGRFWWELRSCTYYSEFEKPKIIWPDISRTIRFAWDEKQYYLGNTGYILPEPPLWLLGILQTQLVEFIIYSITSTIRGGFVRMIDQYMAQIPIVVPQEAIAKKLSELTQKLIKTAHVPNAGASSALENELIEVVAGLYQLTREERLIMDAWLAEHSLDTTGLRDEEEDDE